MTESTLVLPADRQPPLSFGRLLVFYLLLAAIPYAWTLTQGLQSRGAYETVLMFANVLGLAALLAQYPLAGRVDKVIRFTGIDNGMRLHRKAGEVLGIFFFLHPFLIALPRFWIAPERALSDIWTMLVSSEGSTGVYAWTLMGVWVLLAINRDKLRISYEAWRISHGIGFIAVAILATHHAVTVGRHGRYDPWFDVLWIILCTIAVAITAYTYLVRPFVQRSRPFRVVSASKAGASDWCLTIEKDGDFDFSFDAGQFLWINSTGNPFNRTEHPFSIASSPSSLPRISFIIRELGDFTSRLGSLRAGQRIFVDGPHGVFTLTGRKASGIALIAGGAGIGPILGILRQLRDLQDRRPIRLVYGNRRYDQMVAQEEIIALQQGGLDFRQTLVLEQPQQGVQAMQGFIDLALLESEFTKEQVASWTFYVCGPPVMVDAVAGHLRKIGVPRKQILFEQLAF
jgi:predicted ferric reductase